MRAVVVVISLALSQHRIAHVRMMLCLGDELMLSLSSTTVFGIPT